MKKIIKNIKKFLSKKPVLIVGIVVLALAIPCFASALGLATAIGKAIFSVLFINIILPVLGFGVKMAAGFFNTMLNTGFSRSYQSVAQIGWNVSRDFANMFFILFMVIIAFATILRLERYGVKQLLPKVIIIALLINFSMVICAVIIDFSNLSADFFVGKTKTNQANGDIAAILTDSLNLTAVFKPNNCDNDLFQNQRDGCVLITDATKRDQCLNDVQTSQTNCEKTLAATKNASDIDVFGSLMASLVFGTIVLIIAMFTLFAGGILLIIRIVAIWFLVILSPLVFICYIMPGLSFLWKKWWNSFVNWCIFAPAYAFFVWLAVEIARQRKVQALDAVRNSINAGNADAVTGFFASGPNILGFMMVIGFLVGGLIVAKQLGIYGASAALSIGQKWSRGAKDWAKGKAKQAGRAPKEYGAAVTGSAIEGIGKKLQGIRGFKAIGARIESRGKRISEKPLEDAKLQKRVAESTKYMTPDQISHQIEIAKSAGMTRALGMAAIEQKKFSKLSNEAKREVSDNFKAFGGAGTNVAKELEARNPTMRIDRRETDPIKLIAQEAELDQKTEQAVKKGYLGEFSQETFKGAGGQMLNESMLRTAKKFGISIDKMVSTMTIEAQEAWKDTTTTGFGDFSPADMEQRDAYALVTKNYKAAFWDKRLNGGLGDVNTGKLGDFVKSTSPTNLKGIDKENAELIKEHVDISIASEAGGGWSKEIKAIIAPAVEASAKTAKEIKDLKKLKATPAWAPYFK